MSVLAQISFVNFKLVLRVSLQKHVRYSKASILVPSEQLHEEHVKTCKAAHSY